MEAMVRIAACAALGALMWATGCDFESECGAVPECDIREESCQARAARMASCLRDGVPREVTVQLKDFEAFLDDEANAADDVDEAALERSSLWFEGLSLLDLASGPLTPGEATTAFYDSVAAFYDSEEDAITILDRGQSLSSLSDNLLLLHEMIHALQDEGEDLEALREIHSSSFDASLGVDALIEGEAVFHVDRALMSTFEVREPAVDFQAAYASFRQRGLLRAIYATEVFIELRGSFVYPFGAALVHDAWEQDGNRAVGALFDAPPLSARQVMAGFGADEPAGGPWIEPELDSEAIPEVAGMELVRFAHAGRFAAQVLLERESRAWLGREPVEALRRLRNDVLAVLADGDGATLLSWRMRLSDAGQAETLATEATGRLAHHDNAAVFRLERDVVILASEDPELAASLVGGDLEWAPLPEPEEPRGGQAAAPRGRTLCHTPEPLF